MWFERADLRPPCAARTHIRSRVEVVTVFLTMGRLVLYSIGVRTLVHKAVYTRAFSPYAHLSPRHSRSSLYIRYRSLDLWSGLDKAAPYFRQP